MRSGVEHQTGNDSGDDEGDGSNDNDGDGPCWQQGDNVDLSPLVSVGEVVVSAGHVVEGSSLVHLENSSIEVLAGGIQKSTVSDILFTDLSWVSSTVGLVEHGKSKSNFGIFEQWFNRSISEFGISNWDIA